MHPKFIQIVATNGRYGHYLYGLDESGRVYRWDFESIHAVWREIGTLGKQGEQNETHREAAKGNVEENQASSGSKR